MGTFLALCYGLRERKSFKGLLKGRKGDFPPSAPTCIWLQCMVTVTPLAIICINAYFDFIVLFKFLFMFLSLSVYKYLLCRMADDMMQCMFLVMDIYITYITKH